MAMMYNHLNEYSPFQDVRQVAFSAFSKTLADFNVTVAPTFENFVTEVYYKQPVCIETLLWGLNDVRVDLYISEYKADFRNHYGVDVANKQTIETIVAYLTENLEEELVRE